VSDEWDAKLTVLRENVEHHVDEEENEVFDQANEVLTGAKAKSLGDRMQAEKVNRGGSVPAPNTTTEEPGLLSKIANALGVSASTQKASKASRKKPQKRKAARKGSKVAAKLAQSKSTSASAMKKGFGARKGKGHKVLAGETRREEVPRRKTPCSQENLNKKDKTRPIKEVLLGFELI